MEDYEFRIFPPARLYTPPDGAKVFVNLNSDKHTGLGTLVPGNAEVTTVSNTRHYDFSALKDSLGDGAACHGECESATATAVRADTDGAVPQLPPGVTTEGRRLVQYAVGGSAYVRPARFTPVYTGFPSVIICSDTKSFRKLCRTQVCQGDSVIDIGASYGASTQVLFEQCGNVLGLDVSKEAVAEARKRYPEVRFDLMDVLAEPQRLQVVLRERQPNKVFVDIGGNRELPALVALLPALHQTGVAGVYVKSQALIKSALRHLRTLEGGTPASSHSQRPARSTAQRPAPQGAHAPPSQSAVDNADTVAHEAEHGASAHEVHACQSGADCGAERDGAGPGGVGEAVAPAEGPCGGDGAAGCGVEGCCAAATGDGRDVGDEDKHPGGAEASAEAQRKRQARQKRRAGAPVKLPTRVLWRWCNQNMPAAWDLDAKLPEDSAGSCGDNSGGSSGRQAPLTREGLAIVRSGKEWWQQLVKQTTPKKYPLDYPARLTASGKTICRFHNYGSCKRHTTSTCPFDHEHCHACGVAGHTAFSCPVYLAAADPA